jgi:hypothetical protein
MTLHNILNNFEHETKFVHTELSESKGDTISATDMDSVWFGITFIFYLLHHISAQMFQSLEHF